MIYIAMILQNIWSAGFISESEKREISFLTKKNKINRLILILLGGGQIEPCDAIIIKKCLCVHHNNMFLNKKKYPCLLLPYS